MLLVTKLHKYLAYTVILLSQATMGMGIATYFYYTDREDTGILLLVLVYTVFWAVLIASEIMFRIKRRTEVNF